MNHPGSPINRNATILVLSDDIEVRDGVEALLLTDGYRVSPARNAWPADFNRLSGLMIRFLDNPPPETRA